MLQKDIQILVVMVEYTNIDYKLKKDLGRYLKPTEIVHHEHADNVTYLIVCRSQRGHKFMHTWTDALKNSGHVDWRKCKYCKQYDAPENLTISNAYSTYHKSCAAKHDRGRVR